MPTFKSDGADISSNAKEVTQSKKTKTKGGKIYLNMLFFILANNTN